jgi:hypothetical protein
MQSLRRGQRIYDTRHDMLTQTLHTCKWRDLRFTDPELRRHHLVATIALSQSFARRPSYWIDILSPERRVHEYRLIRQWSYRDKIKCVLAEGQTIGRVVDDDLLLLEFNRILDDKIQHKWEVSAITSYDSLSANEIEVVDRIGRSVQIITGKKLLLCLAEIPNGKVRSVRMTELQSKRKALW